MNVDIDLDAVEAEWPVEPAIPAVLQEPELPENLETTAIVVEHRSSVAVVYDLVEARGLAGEITKENYANAKAVAGMCRKARGLIDRRREELNAPLLAQHKQNQAAAKMLTDDLYKVENRLRAGVKAIDNEKANLKREAEEAALKAIQDAERKKLKAEREAEIARCAAEAEANRKESERLADERRALQVIQETQRLEREALEADAAKLKAAQQAAQKEKEDAALAEAQRFQDEQAVAREQARADAIRPDVERVQLFGIMIGHLIEIAPDVRSDEARAVIDRAITDLNRLSLDLQAFGA